jgi:hypothetical protein
MEDRTENTDQVVAEIMCEKEPYLKEGPSLIRVYSARCSLVEL